MGSSSAGGAVTLVHHEPYGSQQRPGSRSTVHPSRDEIILLCSSLMRPEDIVPGFEPPSIRNTGKLARVQQGAPSWSRLEQLPCKERLKDGDQPGAEMALGGAGSSPW